MKNNRIFSQFVASLILSNGALAEAPMPSFASVRAAAIRSDRVATVVARTRRSVPGDAVFSLSMSNR
jgi:hypothetical protein